MDVYTFKHSSITIHYLIDSLLENNKINKEGTIISFGTGSNIVELSNYLASLNIKLYLVIPNDLDENVFNNINIKTTIIEAPSNFGFEELANLANDISLEIENSYVLNLLKTSVPYKIYQNSLNEIMKFDFNNIFIPVGSGNFIRSVSIYLKIMKNCNIIGYKENNKYKLEIDKLENYSIDDFIRVNNVDELEEIIKTKYDNTLLLKDGK